ncbi:hybrid sensor histidine kinase/response regulator transcription factor [Embleya sp. AB8]|uniref:helix-turn-helix transcriptional regulator n=1 Tax=Embleya sp. AB8 TaxID=3156304 RepID=UPI003C71CEFB
MGFGPLSMATLGKAITGRDLPATDPGAPSGPGAGRRAFLARTRTDGLIALVAGVVDLLGYAISAPYSGAGTTTVGALFLAGSAACLMVRRQAPVVVLAVVLVLQSASNLMIEMPQRFGISLAVALYTVGLACRPWTIVAAALATLAAQSTEYRHGKESVVWMASGDIVAILLVLGVSAGVRHWQGQVEVNRILLAERALTDERRRIARELHDIVAHHITTMHLMSGGARASLDRDLDAARAALLTLEASGRVALGEMRQLLGVLRSDHDPDTTSAAPQPGVADLDRLIAESCLAGLPTELSVVGTRRELPLPIGLALYRITQEALTNARKHAGSLATATVRLEYRPGAVGLEVRDDGGGGEVSGGGYAMTGGGHGLVGMRERVAVHGGSFEAGRVQDGGFRVAAVLPVAGEEPAETSAPARAEVAGVPEALAELTPTEVTLLRLVAAGRADAEIAEAMRIDVAEVHRYEARVLAELGLRDRAQAVVLAYECGLVRVGHTAATG